MSLYIPPKLTYEDLLDFPADGKRYEIIGGELFVAASPSVAHQRLLLRIYHAFFQILQIPGWGEIFLAPLDVKLSESDVVEPDLIAIRSDNRVIIQKTHISGVPNILLEVISFHNRRHDEATKRTLYASFGIPEYWLADSVNPGIRGLTLRDGVYHEIPPESDGRIRSVVAPDLILDPAVMLDNLDF